MSLNEDEGMSLVLAGATSNLMFQRDCRSNVTLSGKGVTILAFNTVLMMCVFP
jgi:hypothetical protein